MANFTQNNFPTNLVMSDTDLTVKNLHVEDLVVSGESTVSTLISEELESINEKTDSLSRRLDPIEYRLSLLPSTPIYNGNLELFLYNFAGGGCPIFHFKGDFINGLNGIYIYDGPDWALGLFTSSSYESHIEGLDNHFIVDGPWPPNFSTSNIPEGTNVKVSIYDNLGNKLDLPTIDLHGISVAGVPGTQEGITPQYTYNQQGQIVE